MAAILKSRISQIPQGWQLYIQLVINVGMSYNNNLQNNYCSQKKQLFGLTAGLMRKKVLKSHPTLSYAGEDWRASLSTVCFLFHSKRATTSTIPCVLTENWSISFLVVTEFFGDCVTNIHGVPLNNHAILRLFINNVDIISLTCFTSCFCWVFFSLGCFFSGVWNAFSFFFKLQ